MTYEQEYLATKDRKEFIKLMLERHKHIKEATARRRWYDCRKALGKQQYTKYTRAEKKKPSHFKMVQYNDMKRFNMKITRSLLLKHGFWDDEVNWLEEEEMLNGKS